jgi:hypothetical protein
MKLEFTYEEFNMFIYCYLPPCLTDTQIKNYIKKGIPSKSNEFQENLFTIIRQCTLEATKIEQDDIEITDEEYNCIFRIIQQMIHDKPRVIAFLMPTYREDLIRLGGTGGSPYQN